MGPIRTLLIVANRRSYGGPAILTNVLSDRHHDRAAPRVVSTPNIHKSRCITAVPATCPRFAAGFLV